MYCDFIRKVIHITQSQDFQNIDFLPSLRDEEIKKIYNLFLSDKESQRIAKAEIEINLEKALKFFEQLETEINNILDKIDQSVNEKNISAIEFWTENKNEIYDLLIELDNFISDCFVLSLRYYPEIFQKTNRIELMRQFIPIYEEDGNRKKFESAILHPKGRKKDQRKNLFDYLTDPKKYHYIIAPIRQQYKKAEAKDLFFMVYALIELGIFEKDAIDNSQNHLHSLLKAEFNDKARTHQNFNKHCTNYYKDKRLETITELEKHKRKITEILNRK